MRRLLLVGMLVAGMPAAATEQEGLPTSPFSERVYSVMGAERDRCVGSVRRRFGEGVELHCGYPLLRTKEFLPAWTRAFPEDEIGEGSRPLTAWIDVLGGWLRRYYEVDGVPVLMAYGGKHHGLVIAYYRRYPGCLDGDRDVPRAGQHGVGRPERIEMDWVEAVYPTEARDRRLNGMVMARALIDANGSIRDLCVLDAYPAGYDFDRSALDAWRRDRYRPALGDGQPVEVQLPLVKAFIVE